MKFHWFNLMPWPYLPDDFAEKTAASGSMSTRDSTIPSKGTRSTTITSICWSSPASWDSTDWGSMSTTRTPTA